MTTLTSPRAGLHCDHHVKQQTEEVAHELQVPLPLLACHLQYQEAVKAPKTDPGKSKGAEIEEGLRKAFGDNEQTLANSLRGL